MQLSRAGGQESSCMPINMTQIGQAGRSRMVGGGCSPPIFASVGRHTIGCLSYLKPGAHGEDFAEQNSTNETVLSKILTVCGQFLLRNCPFVAVMKISSMFDNFCHE